MEVLEFLFQSIINVLNQQMKIFNYNISLFNILMFLIVGTVLCIILVRLLDIWYFKKRRDYIWN